MLDIIRKGQRWVTGLFILAVGGVFVFFIGIGAPLQRSATAVVEVGDQAFGFREFSRIRAQRENMFQEQLGKDFDARAMSDTLDQIAVQALIEQAILSQQAEELGLRVSKQEIERYLLTTSAWRGEDGRFDPEQFDGWVQYEYGNQRNFIREQQASMLTNKLLRVIFDLADVSEGEARQAVERRLEEIQIGFVVFDSSTPAESFEPDPAALQTFLETRSDEARALYEERASVYDTPEQVRASHILLKLAPTATPEETARVQAKAEAILERVRAGEDFAALAEEFSEDPGSKSQGGDLGFFGRGQMVEEFEEAAFSREPGAVGDLVASAFGIHILRVDEHRDAQQRSFEEVQDELARELLGREAAREADRKLADELAEAVRGGMSLEAAARERELNLERSGRLRRRPDGFVPNLGAAQDLMAAAFSMEPGESSPRVFEVDGKLALLQLIDRFEPDPEMVATAIENERESLRRQKQQSYLAAWLGARRAELADAGQLSVNLDMIQGS